MRRLIMCLPVFAVLQVCPAVHAQTQAVNLVSSVQPTGTLDLSLQNEVRAAIDRGLNWLAANQKPDGSWSNGDFPALTALPLWVLAREDGPARAGMMDAAIRYVLTCAHDDGSIFKDIPGRKGGGLSNYNTAICMTALHATGRPDLKPLVLKARTFVAGSQYLGDDVYHGGFGYDSGTKRAYTDLLNTYYAEQAMRITANVEDSRPAGEPRADINWNETVRYVERMQNTAAAGPDDAGGFFYNPSDPKAGTTTNAEGVVVFRSFGSMTYVGVLALVFADVGREDVRVRSALKWAERHWTLEENPGTGAEGLYFFYHVLARALAATGHDVIVQSDGTRLDWRAAVAHKLISLQRIDPANGNGYWVNDNGGHFESDPVLVTAYSLLALQALEM